MRPRAGHGIGLAATSAREAELSRETVPGWLGIATAKGGIFGK